LKQGEGAARDDRALLAARGRGAMVAPCSLPLRRP